MHNLSSSPQTFVQKNQSISQRSSIYPTQFHLISGREQLLSQQLPIEESHRSSVSHSQSQSQDYSIAKIR
jgi:hypothetical protein